MKASELKNMSVEDLTKEKNALLKEQFNLRMQKGLASVSKPHLIKKVRKGIARINTLLNERGN